MDLSVSAGRADDRLTIRSGLLNKAEETVSVFTEMAGLLAVCLGSQQDAPHDRFPVQPMNISCLSSRT